MHMPNGHLCPILLNSASFMGVASYFPLLISTFMFVSFSNLSLQEGDLLTTLLLNLTAMSSIFQILMNVSGEFLVRSSSAGGAIDESDSEFAEYVCESMVSLGSSNLQCILGDGNTFSLYIQQMLGFFQHFKLALHYQSLQFWLTLMRDLMSKLKLSVHSSGDGSSANSADSGSAPVDNEKQKILSSLNEDICSAILDTSFQRMLKKERLVAGQALSLGVLEFWSDDIEGKGHFGHYRSRLDLAVMESMQAALESVVSSIFYGLNEFAGGSSEVHLALCGIFEGLLRELLSLNWTEPALVEVLGHYLEAMGPFLSISRMQLAVSSISFLSSSIHFLLLLRILQQAVHDMQGCKFAHRLFE
ncbi:hypothetical protein F3Y22_tig00110321pilonHSYRG00385 [Hibiscus syriacus]|uniref:Exportin-5 C-terminal domain-containing protein n=1 Tax=Hibiscus syriacus TaxID=106335 RepID=A0A6A3B0G7_HIBSY|nr:hypothetical protein F3Y22_tig00110321pilonHSYRG00385 [Hibiscus syriacus]